jgi:hypothetical protein
MIRYKDSVGVIHAEHALGIDYTLCGVALEEDGHGGEITTVPTGRISCVDCIKIIQHCRLIPRTALA